MIGFRIRRINMAGLDMEGPYTFDTDTIDSKTSASLSNYALGYITENGLFKPQYVGRGDVKTRLKAHLKEYDALLFKFSYAKSEKEAYEKECVNYHDFEPEWNDIHPTLPKGVKCPVSTCKHVGREEN